MLVVERDEVIMWAGPLWKPTPQRPNLVLDAASILSYFDHRYILHDRTFTNVDQLQMVRDLLDYAQTIIRPQPHPAPSFLSDLRAFVGVYYEHPNPWTYSGVLRTDTYTAANAPAIGDLIRKLAARRNGFDFTITPYRIVGQKRIAHTLRCGFPRLGVVTQDVIEFGRNMRSYSLPVEGGRKATRVRVLGEGEGPAMLMSTTTSPVVAPLLEVVLSARDVSEQATLDDIAEGQLAARAKAVATITATIGADDDPPLGSYEVGSTMRVRIDDGWVQVDGLYRLVAFTVHPDTDEGETVELSLIDETQVLP